MPRLNAKARAARRVLEEARLLAVKEAAQTDPKALIAEINAFDPTTTEHFKFTMFPADNDPLWIWQKPRAEEGWLWQSALVDWWMGVYNPLFEKFEEWSPNFEFHPDQRVFLTLKARQLGVTWTGMALELWYLLFRPGSRCVIYSYNEDEAKKAITRAWLMFNSLPALLRDHVEVITPSRAEDPAEFIKVRHKATGLISSIQALPATDRAGHGDTFTFAIIDEAAYNKYMRQTFKAVVPATGRGNARLAVISTANGVGNPDTGEGSYFHVLYTTRREKGIAFSFIPWDAEPTRDEAWYQRVAMKMDEVERNQSYPRNEADAFMLSGALFFDRDALAWYRTQMRKPTLRGQFVQRDLRRLDWMELRDGIIEIFERPTEWRKYAIAVDSATGRGLDYTAMAVIDLETGAIVAELHAKMDAARAHMQVYALGKYYNNAKICPETQGGYGETLVTLLRDGSRGLPPYGNIYRHMDATRGNKPISEKYGLPMAAGIRDRVINNLAEWIRLRQFPWVSTGTMDELGTFIYAQTNPSPRAQDGCNDDRVFALGIAAEMFRQFGKAATTNRRPRKKRKYEAPPIRS